MKKQILGMGLAVTFALAASPSFATGNHHNQPVIKNPICFFLPFACAPAKPDKPGKSEKTEPPKPNHPGTPTHSVPEIDAANAGLALALVGGLVAIRRERRNRR
ncbi:hypothetical protein DWB84_00695 [Saccharophagus sp. K07]|uniref:hypothetical protein n=1 Tax=Saccharophagus sp. K07 TaxID=2283636 RepID=UPI001652ABDA|nr:hypothetical protein [Saccharophagus sp. K07]MBC6903992.1 hypothetical protein [Saccharophagus sp. K07]